MPIEQADVDRCHLNPDWLLKGQLQYRGVLLYEIYALKAILFV